jgi:hypothetical protein
MTDRELEDFIKFGEENIVQNGYMVGGGWAKHAITIAKELRDRLAQPEPVHAIDISQERVDETAKRKHEWVGLTDEEIQEMRLKTLDSVATNYETYKAIEAKLKEKNT